MCDEKKLLEKKKKWTNKGNDKHEDADFLLHDTSHTQCLYKIYKILGTVVPEKSLTKQEIRGKRCRTCGD